MAGCGTSLFGPGSQYIKVGNGEFIAVDGSSIFDRLGVSDARMPYKQLLKGRVILKPGQINYLLNHLGLGDNATFLAIKASYNSKSSIEADNYVVYSYYDYPVQNFTFAQLLVLTGNSTHRVPQIYLTNPSTKYAVILDIMVGVIDDNYSFFNDTLNQSGSTFTGLEYTDIQSFVVGESIVVNDKSTPVKPLIYFGLAYINSIALNGTFLIIDDQSQGSIFLKFLTEYDAAQAHSLLNYVLEHPSVDISTLSPPYDNVVPIIYWNPTSGSPGGDYIAFTGLTAGVPYNTGNGFTFSTQISKSIWGSFSGVSGATATLYKETLRTLLIDHITDNRDGTMSMQNSDMIITATSGVVDQISLAGTYSLTFNFEDLAQNNLEGVIVNLDIIV